MSSLGGRTCRSEPGGTCANNGDLFFLFGRKDLEFRLVAGLRVDEAGATFVPENMVEARLIAGDARVD
jgi:hypothetical protein